MKYCIHCGGELVDGARFCSSCGAPVGGGSSKSENSTAKCPQCGERIDAFVAKCPACGHELRGSQTLSRVRELEDDLEGVESPKKRSELIRNFYIPNTKEDIYEFFILATSNLKAGGSDDAAWRAKLEQAMQKAELIFGEGEDLTKLRKVYKKVTNEQRRHNGLLSKLGKFSSASKTMQRLIACVSLILVGVLIMVAGTATGDYIFQMIGMFPIIGGLSFAMNSDD